MKLCHHKDSQALEQIDQKSFPFAVLEIFKTQLVKILHNVIDLIGDTELFCNFKTLSKFLFHSALASNFSWNCRPISCFLTSSFAFFVWKKNLAKGPRRELASLYMSDTEHMGICRWKNHRSKSFRHHYPLNTKLSSSSCKKLPIEFHVLKQKNSFETLFSGFFYNI